MYNTRDEIKDTVRNLSDFIRNVEQDVYKVKQLRDSLVEAEEEWVEYPYLLGDRITELLFSLLNTLGAQGSTRSMIKDGYRAAAAGGEK